jgi:hypothetical protein
MGFDTAAAGKCAIITQCIGCTRSLVSRRLVQAATCFNTLYLPPYEVRITCTQTYFANIANVKGFTMALHSVE